MLKQSRRVFMSMLFLSVALACSGNFSTAELSPAHMAFDEAGTRPTSVFGPSDTFYCISDLAYASEGTAVKASWYAVAVEGASANTFLDESTLVTGSNSVHFHISNNGQWPSGQYKVVLYLNEVFDQEVSFSVQ